MVGGGGAGAPPPPRANWDARTGCNIKGQTNQPPRSVQGRGGRPPTPQAKPGKTRSRFGVGVGLRGSQFNSYGLGPWRMMDRARYRQAFVKVSHKLQTQSGSAQQREEERDLLVSHRPICNRLLWGVCLARQDPPQLYPPSHFSFPIPHRNHIGAGARGDRVCL